MKPGASAQELWNRLAEIFQDNRATRAVYLEEQLNGTCMDAFPNATEYCNRIKSLSDQLANVGHPVSDAKMVLQLVAGLPNDYDTIATFIQQTEPLPSFIKARSQLTLEETRRSKQESYTPQALITQRSDAPAAAASHAQPAARDPSSSSDRGGRGGYRGRGRGGRPPYSQQHLWSPSSWFSGDSWPPPPCPYPTASPHPQPGLLGPGPRPSAQQHALYSAAPYPMHGDPMTPTELDSAFNTMHLHTPDNSWYMDTGSTSHVASSAGSQNGDANHEMQQYR